MQEVQEKTNKYFWIVPVLFFASLWFVKLYEFESGFSLAEYGMEPRIFSGLRGILFAPFIHADWSHVLSNAFPLLFLMLAIFYFFKKKALEITVAIMFMSGLWVWLMARPSLHIGASGLVYGFASFLFFGGIFSKNTRLMAISMLVVFMYGGMVWGIFPDFFPQQNISWESHLMGGLAGLVCAIFYRNSGPQKPKPSWETEEESEDEADDYYIQADDDLNKS
ncbi:MAG: rhomboid family intramembrane serine protease [Bacteroidota bacterium]